MKTVEYKSLPVTARKYMPKLSYVQYKINRLGALKCVVVAVDIGKLKETVVEAELTILEN